MTTIKEIKAEAETIISSRNLKTVTAYLLENLEKEPSKDEINRTCAAPIGVDEDLWPTKNGDKMEHAITVDLNSIPEMKNLFPKDTRAFALFVSYLDENEAFEPNNSETALVLLKESDIAKGASTWEVPEYYECESTTFIPHRIELPEDIFSEDIYDLDENDPLYKFFERLQKFSIVGGRPLWIQGEEYQGDILLQFNEELVDMNLGDAGVMYVFKDTAFWQCS